MVAVSAHQIVDQHGILKSKSFLYQKNKNNKFDFNCNIGFESFNSTATCNIGHNGISCYVN